MVRCIDCGYLAIRTLKTLEEVHRDGDVILSDPSKRLGISDAPICFTRARNLLPEYLASPNMGIPSMVDPRINMVLREERECDSFTKWQQGFTPKEHREMMDREKMLEWQKNREESDRRWRSKQDWKLIIIAGIFTILGAIIGAVTL